MWIVVDIGLSGADMFNMDELKIGIRYLTAFAIGFLACYFLSPRTVLVTEYRDRLIQGEAKTTTKTELVYVPKDTVTNTNGSIVTEKTDIELKIPKQELNIKINGRDAVIHKADEEQYVFEKNKVQLEQKSISEINIAVPTVDNTKRWSVGLGYGNHGIAGTLDFPVHKSVVGGWAYMDRDTRAAGLKVNF